VALMLRELLGQCRNGEEEAIVELVRRFQPWALNLARAFVLDADLAEDAVQESFVDALKRLPDLRDPDAFPGWFRQIIRTHACRITRSRREVVGETNDEVASGQPSPRQSAERKETAVVVREALASLPPQGREAVELFYLEERSCREIAGSLRIPEGTVKRRLHDARRRLRGMLLGYVGPAIIPKNKKKKRPGGLPL
jgi:RNA polymerase sigma factor (sigma-70 family)